MRDVRDRRVDWWYGGLIVTLFLVATLTFSGCTKRPVTYEGLLIADNPRVTEWANVLANVEIGLHNANELVAGLEADGLISMTQALIYVGHSSQAQNFLDAASSALIVYYDSNDPVDEGAFLRKMGRLNTAISAALRFAAILERGE